MSSVGKVDAAIKIEKPLFENQSHECFIDTSGCIFLLQRKIEQAYQNIPFPSSLQHAVIYTEVFGGKGDISAASKVIALLKRLQKDLHIDWVLDNGKNLASQAVDFLEDVDLSLVTIRDTKDEVDETLAHQSFELLICGPYVSSGVSLDDITRKIQRILAPFAYVEFGEIDQCFPKCHLKACDSEVFVQDTRGRISLYQKMFPSESLPVGAGVAMGLYEASGLWFEQKLVSAPLSQQFFCPSYLCSLKDLSLQKNIFEALKINDLQPFSSIHTHSFNFGYAHRLSSLCYFIDATILHEQKKHVVIVFNQKINFFGFLSLEKCCEKIFTARRLAFIKNLRFHSLILVDADEKKEIRLQKNIEGKRALYLILRQQFFVKDMQHMQLSAERIMATGDSSAAEALAARCKLFLYEKLTHKKGFVEQKIALASSLGLDDLARFWSLFSCDSSGPGRGSTMGPMDSDEMYQLLSKDTLSEQTYRFCLHVVEKYDFEKRFTALCKRIFWHKVCPEMQKAEFDTFGEEFFAKIQSFLVFSDSSPLTLDIPEFSLLYDKLNEIANKKTI